MRIRLVETETVANIEPNLESLVFPALEKIGFYFDVNVKIPRTLFDVIYLGTYKRDNRSVGVRIEFVTTHIDTEEWNDPENREGASNDFVSDATLKLIVSGKKYTCGPICTSKPKTVVAALVDTIESEDINFYSEFATKPGEELIPALNNPDETHTEADWKKIAQEQLDALVKKEISSQAYSKFINDVYPLGLPAFK